MTKTTGPRLILEEYKLKQDPQDYGIADEIWDLEKIKKKMKIVIVRHENMELEFDLIGCYPSIANAFRRLMLSEVPSMAIEKVYIYNNTSIMQDEVLAHRLGLIPLKADSRLFEYRTDTDEGNEHDTLEFELKVRCTKRNDPDTASFDRLYKNHKVYSGQIKWLPKGRQSSCNTEESVGSIHSDILINKMRQGQEMDLKLIAVKGIGKDHAKFSPVATAFYRLLPHIEIVQPVGGEDAKLLQTCFSPNVIDIDSNGMAYVKDSRYDTCSRNVYRYPHLKDSVSINRIRDHFIFTVESVGALKPEVIFIEAVKCLKKKCNILLNELNGK